MGLSAQFPVPDRKANLLRAMRGLPPKLERSFYEPSVDRPLLYKLPQRARFWPGSDELYGAEWQYWYGDIDIPEELAAPRRRPSCLGDEDELTAQLRSQLISSGRLSRLEQHRQQLEQRQQQQRRQRSSSASRLESALESAEQSMAHLSRARQLRASSVSRLNATRESMERDARVIRASSLNRRAGTPTFSDDPYADIEIPELLLQPRRRPVTLESLNDMEQGSAATQASQYLRSLQCSSSVQKMSSVETSSREVRSSIRGRVASEDRLQQARNQEQRRQPAPLQRTYTDLKHDYDDLLSNMGVTKELKMRLAPRM